MAQRGIDVDAFIGQQPVHLLDGVLGHQAARQGKALPDRVDREGCSFDDAEGGIGEG